MSGSEKAGLREAILATSLELGTQFGEDGLTMRGIASRLGVSATALYQHFDSKGAILREIRMHGLRELTGQMLEAFNGDDIRLVIVEASRRYLAYARANPWLYQVLMQTDSRADRDMTEDQLAATKALTDSMRDTVARVAKPVANGSTPGDTVRFMARWWSSLHGIASLILSGRISEDHPVLAVDSVDGFIQEAIDNLVVSLRPDLKV